ncbi:hypothetical protein [Moorena sp. SIO4G3]|uniref:hypothetical protein n=1 Tax=Moorena sp. SIO4G3 TaxID=2607821 RepID=UPI00142BC41F|nr:hypothetical protein [Moorena sp. SIO4G3]NEO76883.1 hypothetical protein [Moorena sp. SIO4G3]
MPLAFLSNNFVYNLYKNPIDEFLHEFLNEFYEINRLKTAILSNGDRVIQVKNVEYSATRKAKGKRQKAKVE